MYVVEHVLQIVETFDPSPQIFSVFSVDEGYVDEPLAFKDTQAYELSNLLYKGGPPPIVQKYVVTTVIQSCRRFSRFSRLRPPVPGHSVGHPQSSATCAEPRSRLNSSSSLSSPSTQNRQQNSRTTQIGTTHYSRG